MPKKDIRLFLFDIKTSVDAIRSYVEDMNYDDFIGDRKTYNAVIREFEIIGEAAKHLPSDLLSKYNEVEWRDIKDFRNLLIHEYFGVDLEIVWNTVCYDIPLLKRLIEKIISENT